MVGKAVLRFSFLKHSSPPPSLPPQGSMIVFKFPSGLKFGIQKISSALLNNLPGFPEKLWVPCKGRDTGWKNRVLRQVTDLLRAHGTLKNGVFFLQGKFALANS